MRIALAIMTLLLALAAPGTVAQTPAVPANTRLVLSHFKNDGGGGDERLYISVSPDGLVWTPLNAGNPVWQPPGWAPFGNVVRDPTIIYDNGNYWVAYTSGNYGKHASFGLVKSTDLLNWTFVGEISTSIPGATDPLTWNPCFFRDGDGSVHIFVSVSPVNGSSYDPIPAMRSYEVHPVSADWTQWSTPVAVALPHSNTNELWVWKEGTTYHAVYVNFSDASIWYHATSTNLLTGWTGARRLGFRTEEGGFVLKKPDGGYRFYLEPGNSGGNAAGTYRYYDVNEGFDTFGAPQSVQSPIGHRNGKATAIAGIAPYSEWRSRVLGQRPPGDQVPGADPDADGTINALEFAYDLDPLHPELSSGGPSAVEAVVRANGVLQLNYRRIPALAGVSSKVEFSSDLQLWKSDGALTLSSTLMTDGSEAVRVLDTGAAGNTNRFVRLQVTVTP